MTKEQRQTESGRRILVTGGAGFLGSHICEKLLLSGNDVIVIDFLDSETNARLEKRKNIENLRAIAQRHSNSKFKFYELDLLVEDLLTEIIQKEAPSYCVHAAALVMDRKSVFEANRYIKNNVQGTQCLLNALHSFNGFKKLVLISSRSAVGETKGPNDKVTEENSLRPINPYGATKAASEALCFSFHKNYNISVVVIRLWPLYGPRSRKDMMPRLLLESVIDDKIVDQFGDGTAIRDWLFVEDAANGILSALDHSTDFSIFNLGTGIGTSLNELIQLVEDVTGKKIKLNKEDTPIGDAVFGGVCDYDKAQEIFGWQPLVNLKSGLMKTYEYLRNTHDPMLR